MAAEAAGLHIYSVESDGDEVPVPSATLSAEDTEGCLVSPVTIFPDLVKNEMDNKRVKTNINTSGMAQVYCGRTERELFQNPRNCTHGLSGDSG